MLPPPGFSPTPVLAIDLPTSTAALLDVATAISSAISPYESKPENGECSLLGPFAILVQGALGLLAISALVYKRWRERPQRPLKIWFFDASKQVVGSILVHVANLGMSMLSSGQLTISVEPATVTKAVALAARSGKGYTPNPCSFYLLNLAIDTTIGIPILILLVRIFTALFLMTPLGNPPESIQSGNYGHPPRATWWFKQSLIYFLGLMGMKICVLIIFLALPWISQIGDWALRWTEGNEALQVVFVMLVFPLIMNATQYYIIDTFIKKQNPGDFDIIPEDDVDEADPYEEGGSSEEIGSSDEDDKAVEAEIVKHKGKGPRSPLRTGNRDYDPLVDGESSPSSSKLVDGDAERK